MFSFSRIFFSKYWKRLKISLIVTLKHPDLSNGGLFWKSLVPFFKRTYALSFGFRMLNDTHREKLCFIKFSSRMAGWLLLTFLICSIIFYYMFYYMFYYVLLCFFICSICSVIHSITPNKSTDVWKGDSSNRQ